jgi:hypothetical protein
MMPCVQCNTELLAPERSEYWSDRHACHIWLCPTCSACFGSLVSFPTDSESMGDQFARPIRASHRNSPHSAATDRLSFMGFANSLGAAKAPAT